MSDLMDSAIAGTLWACTETCRPRTIRRGKCDCEKRRQWAKTVKALPDSEREWVARNLALASDA